VNFRAWMIGLMLLGGCSAVCQPPQPVSPDAHAKFESALQRFGIDHDRVALRKECTQTISADPTYALPIFYLGVLDEADEKWLLAQRHFNQFLSIEKDSELSNKGRQELKKLPLLIKEDSTPLGKLDRQYRQRLGYADLLQRRGFSKEAFLEAAEAVKLRPERWEAYAVASSIMLSQKLLAQASHFLELARSHLPPDSTGKLSVLEEQIKQQSSAAGK
jgi:tetratricopeptide (TPR) repeat protein